MCLRVPSLARPHHAREYGSVPCGMISRKHYAGCGALASARKGRIGPISTTCADRARNGMPSTAVWLRKRTPSARQARRSTACPDIAPETASFGVAGLPPGANSEAIARNNCDHGSGRFAVLGTSLFLPACFRWTVMRRLRNKSAEWVAKTWGWKHGNSLRDPR